MTDPLELIKSLAFPLTALLTAVGGVVRIEMKTRSNKSDLDRLVETVKGDLERERSDRESALKREADEREKLERRLAHQRNEDRESMNARLDDIRSAVETVSGKIDKLAGL